MKYQEDIVGRRALHQFIRVTVNHGVSPQGERNTRLVSAKATGSAEDVKVSAV